MFKKQSDLDRLNRAVESYRWILAQGPAHLEFFHTALDEAQRRIVETAVDFVEQDN